MTDLLIIGGGVAGLSAGVYAQLAGHSATVAEQNPVAGGNLTGWKRGEYRIDNCIHWLTGTNPASPHYKMWTDLGVLGGVRILEGESLYTFEHEGQRLGLCRDLDRLEREMLAISPGDRELILDFTKAVRTVQGLNGVGGPAHDKKLGAIKSAAALPMLIRYYRMTTGEFGKRFSNPLLQKFFTSLFTDRFGALSLLFVFADYCAGNADMPEGGSVAMAKRLVGRFTSLGGKLLLNKRAVRARLDGDRVASVAFADGSELNADRYIFAQDPASVFGKLLRLRMPRRLAEYYGDEGLMRFSSWHCAFAVDAPEPGFRGDLIFELAPELRRELNAHFLVLREYSYLEGCAPEGKCLIQTLVFCEESTCREFIALRNAKDSKAEYNTKKQTLAALTQRAIEEKLPELAGKLRLIDMWTPATYHRYTGSEVGSYMSFAFRSNVLPAPLSGRIDGLTNAVLATQWLLPPGGLPIAAEAGKRAILALFGKRALQNC